MSNTLTKNLVLSQPKAGHDEVDYTPVLTHSSTTEEKFTLIKVEIPGVDPSTVDVMCENNSLHISCVKGNLTVPVDPSVDVSGIQADVMWGLLTVKIPRPTPPASKSIKVSIHDAVKKMATKFTSED